jgi:uncharacterized membrane protein
VWVVEYNYTKEWKQPRKIYTWGPVNFTNFVSGGIKASYLILMGIAVLGLLVVIFLVYVKGITFLSNLFKKTWILILFFIGVGLWVLFSMKWENKTIFRYLIGKHRYQSQKGSSIEHEDQVVYLEESYRFSTQRRR